MDKEERYRIRDAFMAIWSTIGVISIMIIIGGSLIEKTPGNIILHTIIRVAFYFFSILVLIAMWKASLFLLIKPTITAKEYSAFEKEEKKIMKKYSSKPKKKASEKDIDKYARLLYIRGKHEVEIKSIFILFFFLTFLAPSWRGSYNFFGRYCKYKIKSIFGGDKRDLIYIKTKVWRNNKKKDPVILPFISWKVKKPNK